jgi:hypothetical protein
LSTYDLIVELFCRIDDQMREVQKDPRAHLYPSEIVTLGVLFVLKGKGARAFHRWLRNNYLHLFPCLPERTRLFRLLAAHRNWADRFLAEPTLLGICDSFGVELIHPRREGRSEKQIGKKGLSNHRWIVGVKWCPLVNWHGQLVDWDAEGANVHDGEFQRMLVEYETGERGMGVYVDSNFHIADKRGGDCTNLKVCKRGECNLRFLIETLLSQVTGMFAMKKIGQRAWVYVEARLGFAAAAYNLLISWGGTLRTDENGYVRLSIAEFVI